MRLAAIIPCMPWPARGGVQQMGVAYLQALGQAAPLDAVCLVDEVPDASAAAALAATCARSAAIPFAYQPWRSLLRALGDRLPPTSRHYFDAAAAAEVVRFFAGRQYDAALVFDLPSLAYAEFALPGVPWWLARSRVDGVFADLSAAVQGRTWRSRLRAFLVRRGERRASRRVAGQIVCAESDRVGLRRIIGDPRPVIVVPNGIDPARFPDLGPLPSTPSLIFVGGMDYEPNADAMRWFVADIWPLVRAELPSASLVIVGRNPGPDIRALAAVPGITVTGGVPELAPYYAQARAAIAPVRIAGGTRLKVVEAWASARPLIATSAAVDGLDADDGSTLIADTPPAFAAAILRVLRDEGLAQRLSAGAWRRAACYAWSEVTKPMIAAMTAGRT